MKYLVAIAGEGEGCDYTIGCNMNYEIVEAKSIEEVIEKVVWPDGKDEYSRLEGEIPLAEILIVPADKLFRVDVVALKRKIFLDKEKRKQEEKDASERATYDALKKKYG